MDIRFSENTSQASLWQFKMVIETGDVRYLLILNDYEQLPDIEIDQLSSAWHVIYQEFSDIAGGSRADLWLVKVKRMTVMQLDLQRQSSLLRMIELMPIPELIEEARKEGFFIDLKDFKKTFEKAYTKLMRLKNRIDIDLKAKEKDVEEDQSLDGLIADLEKFQGYQFDEQKMTVKKFANIYKNYKDAREQDR